jgi:hypothetical protein
MRTPVQLVDSMSSIQAELTERRARGALAEHGTRLSRDQLLRRLRAFGRRLNRPHDDFLSNEQELVVYRALEGEDVLAVMPTGSGKSLTYQFTGYLRPDELTLVITPLKALIQQQDELLPFGVGLTSETLNRDAVWDSLLAKKDHVLFVSPEMLSNPGFHNRLAHQLRRGRLKIGRFVVDEVHCLSDWGHDFRPHYWWTAHYLRLLEKHIPSSTKSASHVPLLLLTATADEQVMRDIRRHFPEIEDNEIVRGHAARRELVLATHRVDNSRQRIGQLVKFLRRQGTRRLPPGTLRRGIIFTLEAVSGDGGEEIDKRRKSDRLKADDVVHLLRKRGLKKVHTFSAKGMNSVGRKTSQRAFEKASSRRGQVTAIVATSAFGMGMDYPGVPFICHLYPRSSVSEYWQQVGRAGRGMVGDQTGWAEALGLYSVEDYRYAVRFAKAPALDGLINAFTIPLHGWMYVMPPGGGHMSEYGGGGGRTRFSRLLEALQGMGVISKRGHRVAVPRGAIRYRVDLRLLRRASVLTAIDRLQDDEFDSKRLNKVFRYLRVASKSKPRAYITLNRWLYDHDRQGSVLQRLNRWVDAGCLEIGPGINRRQEIRLFASRRGLTLKMLRAIVKAGESWAEHKRDGVREMMSVLRAPSPTQRQRRVLEHFGQDDWREFKHDADVIRALPKWLATR